MLKTWVKMRGFSILILVLVLFTACTQPDNRDTGKAALDSTMTPVAERYVKLVLAVGEHSADYVDALPPGLHP